MIYLPNQKPPIWSIDPGIVAYNYQKHGFPHPVLDTPMWEGAGPLARDYSGHGNHGTLTGQPDWVADGLDLDGDNDCMEVTGVTAGTSHTISAWIKTSYHTQYIFDSETGRVVLGQTLDGTTLEYYDGAWHDSGFTINDGSLHFVAVSKSGTNISMYMDNQSIDTSGAAKSIGGACIVGARYTVTSNFFNGIINNVSIFNTALSAAQVKFLYDNPYFMYQIPEELYGYVAGAPPPASIINQFMRSNLGSDLYNGVLQ